MMIDVLLDQTFPSQTTTPPSLSDTTSGNEYDNNIHHYIIIKQNVSTINK